MNRMDELATYAGLPVPESFVTDDDLMINRTGCGFVKEVSKKYIVPISRNRGR
jgi:hypothetical protein